MGNSKLAIALLAFSTSAFGGQTFMVDDDGKECPQSLTSIQAAVDQASAGDTIVVCRGTYLGSVRIMGHEKDGLRLMTRQLSRRSFTPRDAVVIQGNHTEATGIALKDVDGVVVLGFTIRDFGTGGSQSPDEEATGKGIELLHANSNTIRSNEIFANDGAGIVIVDSSRNIIEDNVIRDNDPNGTGRGIDIQPLKAKDATSMNVVRRNRIYGNPLAGIILRNAGQANEVVDNDLDDNGRYGLANIRTNGTHIASNRASRERGLWPFPAASQDSYGVYVGESDGTDVNNITAYGNSHTAGSFDLFWDGRGKNRFLGNDCGRGSLIDLCSGDSPFPEHGPKQY